MHNRLTWRQAARIGAVLMAAALVPGGCSRPPTTAADIVARSVQAHGGPALTSWTTMTVTGHVRMSDGIDYNAAYVLRAQAPGKLRVEHDLTADRGRGVFSRYFLNDGVAWTRRNLVVSPYDRARAQRLLDHCVGVALYARPGLVLERRPDARVTWPGVEGWDPAVVPAPRDAFVVAATIGNDTREILIDKETFYLLKETIGSATRYYTDVRPFGGVRMATRVLEVAKTRSGESSTPFVFESVTFNAPIEASLFTEDMPRASARTGKAAAGSPE